MSDIIFIYFKQGGYYIEQTFCESQSKSVNSSGGGNDTNTGNNSNSNGNTNSVSGNDSPGSTSERKRLASAFKASGTGWGATSAVGRSIESSQGSRGRSIGSSQGSTRSYSTSMGVDKNVVYIPPHLLPNLNLNDGSSKGPQPSARTRSPRSASPNPGASSSMSYK